MRREKSVTVKGENVGKSGTVLAHPVHYVKVSRHYGGIWQDSWDYRLSASFTIRSCSTRSRRCEPDAGAAASGRPP
jgi:hypothetical protein